MNLKRPGTRIRKPRQEISIILKYLVFAVNFFVFVCGVTSIILGTYLYLEDIRPISDLGDVLLNPGIVFTLLGLVVAGVSLTACLGALRENVCLLKSFALSVFFCYILLVVGAFLLFILFYSDSSDGISIQTVLVKSVKNYHTSRNYRDFIDYVQEQMNCCGATSHGYKDWRLNAQYNCSDSNPQPERCGVPFSCCRKPFVYNNSKSGPEAVLSAMRSYQCWQNAQKKSHTELESLIYVVGCLTPVRNLFEKRAVAIGAVIGGLVIPVCISVMFANILAKQIERQHFLLAKEARREAKKRRKARQKFRDPYAIAYSPPDRTSRQNVESAEMMDETLPNPLPSSPNKRPVRKRSRQRQRARQSAQSSSPSRKKSAEIPPPRRRRSSAAKKRYASEPVHEAPQQTETEKESKERSCSDLSQV